MNDDNRDAGQLSVDRPTLVTSVPVSEFLSQVMAETEYLTFGNPHGFRFDRRLLLKDVWIPQEVTVYDGGEALSFAAPTERLQLARRETLQIDAALNMDVFTKAVIIGKPGYGKTTLCRRLAYNQALSARVTGRGWIPIRLNAHVLNTRGVWTSLSELMDHIGAGDHSADLHNQLAEAGLRGQLWFFVDGLDEVDEALLPQLRSKLVSDILASPNRVTLTCRVADYLSDYPLRRLDGLPVLELSPFSEDRVDLYIETWHKHAGRDRPGWTGPRVSATRGLLDAHSELRDLAATPLLAAVLCVVESRHRQALLGRAALLKAAIDYLLLRTEWRHGDSIEQYSASIQPETLIEIAGKLAYRMLGGDRAPAEADAAMARTMTRDAITRFISGEIHYGPELVAYDESSELQAATVAYLDRLVGRTTAGLLHERKSGTYEFAHRTFQEYLAAQHLGKYVSHRERLQIALQPAWREVFILMASIAESTREGLVDLLMLARSLLQDAQDIPRDEDQAEQVSDGACLAAEMLAEIGEPAARRYGLEVAITGEPSNRPDDEFFSGLWKTAVRTVFSLAEASSLPRSCRLRALCVASRLRDPRFVDTDGAPLAALSAVVEIPGGQGRVGTNRPLLMRELKQVPSSPSMEVAVSRFRIGRTLVTNIEYGQFVDSGGYDNPSWWREPEAEQWRSGDPDFIEALVELWEAQKDLNFVKEFGEPEFSAYAETASERIAQRTMARNLPLYWRDTRFNLSTAPVVGVNMWEAKAYCSWLEHRWRQAGVIGEGEEIGLPTEIEWEWAAARGWSGSSISYPWGNEPDSDRCLIRDFSDPSNPRIIHFGGIPVGFYSLNGRWSEVDDLAGNVWEWVTSLSLPWAESFDREKPGGLDKRVVRGSSWFSREALATHVSFRLDDPPCNAYWDLGFRVAVRSRRHDADGT